MLKHAYFECACYSPEHMLRFTLADDELYAYVFLRPEPLLARLWKAVKYIFGYQCRYGHFDEFVLRPEDAERLSYLLEKYKEQHVTEKR